VRSRAALVRIPALSPAFALVGSVEGTSDEQARDLFDAGFFGAMNVLRAALPVLWSQRSGRVFQMSSIFGEISFPATGMLAAVKQARDPLPRAASPPRPSTPPARPDHPVTDLSQGNGSSVGPSSAASSTSMSGPLKAPGQRQWPNSKTPQAVAGEGRERVHPHRRNGGELGEPGP
jgi:NAD(P)-dependent dehydrogenase (short-subunit alcohol dehydrogenase family)